MTRRLMLIGAATILVGCTPSEFTRPSFPAVPPEPAAKKDAEKTKADDKPAGVLSPSQVNERNVRKSLEALDAEIEAAAGK